MSDEDTSRPAAATEHAARPSAVPWPPLLLAGAVLAAFMLGSLAPLPWPGLDDLPARVIGYGLGLLGLALAAWSVLTLVKAGTTIRPDAAASVLVTTGPYHRLRNPIYLADVLVLLGLAQVTYNIWFVVVAALFAILVTWLAILPEERHLAGRFGELWQAYKERSRRWI